MATPLEGRAYVVTGSGRGIGSEVAKLIGSLGGSVVVNDPGVNLDGSGSDSGPAAEIAKVINDQGIGKAVAAGAMQIRPEWGQMPPAWMPYFQTEDLEAAVARAESHGGAMLMAPMDLPYVGRCALLQDPQGAIFMALQRGAAPAKPAPAKAEVVEEVEEVEEVEALEEIDDAEEVAQADVDAGDDDDDDIAAQVEADLVSADAGEPDEAEADDDEADADAGDETADDDETPADEADADDDANHHNA